MTSDAWARVAGEYAAPPPPWWLFVQVAITVAVALSFAGAGASGGVVLVVLLLAGALVFAANRRTARVATVLDADGIEVRRGPWRRRHRWDDVAAVEQDGPWDDSVTVVRHDGRRVVLLGVPRARAADLAAVVAARRTSR